MSIFCSVKYAMLRWLALHVHNIVDQGSMERGLGQEKNMCWKTVWFTLALTDMKNGKEL